MSIYKFLKVSWGKTSPSKSYCSSTSTSTENVVSTLERRKIPKVRLIKLIYLIVFNVYL